MMRPVSRAALAAAVVMGVGVFASPLLAVPLLGNVGTEGPNAISYTLGFGFHVGSQPISVTHLGLWDADSDGLLADHAVGLWTLGGTLVHSVTVPAGTSATLLDEYRYLELDEPLLLSAGETYVVGAAYATDDEYSWFSSFDLQPIVASGVTLEWGRFREGATLTFPNLTTSLPYTGPNLQFDVVPEPASATLIACGAALILRGRRRAMR